MRIQLRDVRLHFLAAMGLSCHAKEASHAEPRAEIVVAQVDAGPLALPPAPPDPPRCGPDEAPLTLRLDAPCKESARFPSAGNNFCSPLARDPVVRLVSESGGACMYHACIRLTLRPASGGPDEPGPGCCIPMPDRPSSVPASGPSACPAGLDGDLAFVGTEDGRCCYHRRVERRYRGRPVRCEGEPVVASAMERAGWAGATRPSRTADGSALEWLEDAAMEHASIASFAQLSLVLMAHGAPADLLRDCHLAALDEIEHARVSYGIASARAGRPLGPGRITPPPLDASMRALVMDTVRDGCVGETIAALEAAASAERAAPGDERDAFEMIASDELAHAALAWRILAWAVETGHDDVAPAMAAARDALASHATSDDDERVIREVVAPCLDALAHAAA